jgi:polyisoprenoid-binding protein YceI
MKRYTFLLILGLSVLSSFSQNEAHIDFVIKNLGINVDGHFERFTITSNFDTNENLTEVSGKIEVSSIKTGMDSRDEHLLKEDYFDANHHKYISLKSSSVTKTSDQSYNVVADLTIKGKTKQLMLNVDVIKTKDGFKITSSFEINRKDFNVGGSSFVLSKTAKINVIHYQKL